MKREKIPQKKDFLGLSAIGKLLKRTFQYRIILAIFVIYLAGKSFISYYKPFKFEIGEVIGDRGKEFLPSAYIRILFSTEHALLPYEPMKVKILFFPASRAWQKYINDTSNTIQLLFKHAHLTDSKINGRRLVKGAYDDVDLAKLPNRLMHLFADPNGALITLQRNADNDSLYFGDAEIYYGEPKDHEIVFVSAQSNFLLSTKLEIGSSVDLSNKKTNDLMYVIALINLIFLPYAEFFKRNNNEKPSSDSKVQVK